VYYVYIYMYRYIYIYIHIHINIYIYYMYVIGLFILTSALAPRTGTVTATQRRMIEALKTAHLTITPNKVFLFDFFLFFLLFTASGDSGAKDPTPLPSPHILPSPTRKSGSGFAVA